MSVLGPAPPGLTGDRPDTKLRGNIDPTDPPDGYYEPESAALRNQVRRALASMLGKLTRPMRRRT
jgi:hypothetical protein